MLHEGEEQATSMAIELLSTLEPSMLAVFGVMAIAGTVHRRFRKS